MMWNLEINVMRRIRLGDWFMERLAGVVLAAGVLLVAVLPCAAVKNSSIRITVLDSETHSITLDDSGVPKNCDGVNYDAYCHSSKTVEVINTLLVQEADNPPFHVSCSINTKWSRCVPLLKGTSFDAKREKSGLTIYYLDDNGKLRKQLYTYADEDKKGGAAVTAAAETNAAPAATRTAAAPVVLQAAKESSNQTVKCSFTSTPPGAEVSVDGQYVGSTPSIVNVRTGKHEVVIAMLGFAQWKRELTVAPGSELTVNAVLEKAQ